MEATQKVLVPEWAMAAARKVAEWEYTTFLGERYCEENIRQLALRIEAGLLGYTVTLRPVVCGTCKGQGRCHDMYTGSGKDGCDRSVSKVCPDCNGTGIPE